MGFIWLVATSVLIGNILTAMFLVALKRLATCYTDDDAPWWAIVGGLVPLIFIALTLLLEPETVSLPASITAGVSEQAPLSKRLRYNPETQELEEIHR